MSVFDSLPPNDDDQRAHPRETIIEKIADVAYDTLRKHEGPWQSGDSSENQRSGEE